MRDKHSFSSLKEVLGTLFREGGLPFNFEDALIWKVWEDVVGHAVACNAEPLWIRKGRLRVGVSDPIWLQELKFVEENIRLKLNERLGRTAVEKIEFRVTLRVKNSAR
jgi:predicted nucleic acid-binding Zn ribbon protein